MDDLWIWLLIALGLLVGIFVVIVLIGSFLPRRHVVACALTTHQSAEPVWQVITDFASVPKWHKDITAVERLPDRNGHPVWRETYRGNYPILMETVEAVEPRRLVRRIADERGPFSGRWEFDLTPEGEGCRITLTEHGDLPNPFFRFMARVFMDPALYLELYLRALAVRLGQAQTAPRQGPEKSGEENAAGSGRGLPPAPPTDPYVRVSRIRLV
jgi:hypothetical protein